MKNYLRLHYNYLHCMIIIILIKENKKKKLLSQ
jgi:hypothetical protein